MPTGVTQYPSRPRFEGTLERLDVVDLDAISKLSYAVLSEWLKDCLLDGTAVAGRIAYGFDVTGTVGQAPATAAVSNADGFGIDLNGALLVRRSGTTTVLSTIPSTPNSIAYVHVYNREIASTQDTRRGWDPSVRDEINLSPSPNTKTEIRTDFYTAMDNTGYPTPSVTRFLANKPSSGERMEPLYAIVTDGSGNIASIVDFRRRFGVNQNSSYASELPVALADVTGVRSHFAAIATIISTITGKGDAWTTAPDITLATLAAWSVQTLGAGLNGIRNLRTVAYGTLTGAGLAGDATGEIVYVPGYGLYRYYALGSLGAINGVIQDNPPFRVPALGSGAWVHELASSLFGGNGTMNSKFLPITPLVWKQSWVVKRGWRTAVFDGVDQFRIYTCVGNGTTESSGTGPTSTDEGPITGDGTVTWQYYTTVPAILILGGDPIPQYVDAPQLAQTIGGLIPTAIMPGPVLIQEQMWIDETDDTEIEHINTPAAGNGYCDVVDTDTAILVDDSVHAGHLGQVPGYNIELAGCLPGDYIVVSGSLYIRANEIGTAPFIGRVGWAQMQIYDPNASGGTFQYVRGTAANVMTPSTNYGVSCLWTFQGIYRVTGAGTFGPCNPALHCVDHTGTNLTLIKRGTIRVQHFRPNLKNND